MSSWMNDDELEVENDKFGGELAKHNTNVQKFCLTSPAFIEPIDDEN